MDETKTYTIEVDEASMALIKRVAEALDIPEEEAPKTIIQIGASAVALKRGLAMLKKLVDFE